jgi:hypothetical protein
MIDKMRSWLAYLFRKKKLKELFQLTADAFLAEMPELHRLTYDACLLKYAEFTKNQAQRCLQGTIPAEEVKIRLYDHAYRFGRELGRGLHIRTWDGSMNALVLIYQLIGIRFRYDAAKPNDLKEAGANQCKFKITECFFSNYYSPETCALISSLDEGLAAGLTGGGKLTFTQRITEGPDCCCGTIVGQTGLNGRYHNSSERIEESKE